MTFSVCYSWQSVVLGAAVDEVAFGDVAFGELAFYCTCLPDEQSTFVVLLCCWLGAIKDTSPVTAGDVAVKAVADCRSSRRCSWRCWWSFAGWVVGAGAVSDVGVCSRGGIR